MKSGTKDKVEEQLGPAPGKIGATGALSPFGAPAAATSPSGRL